jgi:hypothetical protein
LPRRNRLVPTFFILLAVLLGLAGYLIANPDSELWPRLARLPWVGDSLAEARQHLVAEKQRRAASRRKSRLAQELAEPPHYRQESFLQPWEWRRKAPSPGGANDGTPAYRALSRVWVAPGIEIRESADEASPLLHTMTLLTTLPSSGRRGDFFRVRYQGVEGWVHLPGYDRGDPAAPPLGDAPEPPGPLPAHEPDPEILAKARALLGDQERVGQLGPYQLYADFEDKALVAMLDGLAKNHQLTYEARYGRPAVGAAKGAVVLFALEGAYRIFHLQSDHLRGLFSSGHNNLGVVALYRGDRPAEEVGATLVHELTHLMNRRALGPALPAWLDEGLCEDLALARIGPGGELHAAEIGGGMLRGAKGYEFTGALSTFYRLRAALLDHRLPSYLELSSPSWRGFDNTADRRASYDLAGAWVRYLVDGENGKRAPAFRAFLASVAAGEEPSGDRLFAKFEDGREVVEAGFRLWLSDGANRLLGPP